jgi:hypothetical protein
MSSEINQAQKDKYHIFSLTCGILNFKKVKQKEKLLRNMKRTSGMGESSKCGQKGTNTIKVHFIHVCKCHKETHFYITNIH